MTEDNKATRLSKAAREFNVGIPTIVEFLNKKGFDIDQNPNTKIPQEAYALLVKEYSSDLKVKKESESIGLKEFSKKKESLSIDNLSEKENQDESKQEEEVIIKDPTGTSQFIEIKTEVPKPKVVGKIDLGHKKSEKPSSKEKEVVEPVAVEPKKADVVEDKKEQLDKTPVIEKQSDKKESAKETVVEEKHSESKPQESSPISSNASEKEENKKEDGQEPVYTTSAITKEENKNAEIFRPETPNKLSGPTIIGKIELPSDKKPPVQHNNKPENNNNNNNSNNNAVNDFKKKKKRKRIIKEQEPTSVAKATSVDNKDKNNNPNKQGKKNLKAKPLRAEIDDEEVQKQVKETLRKLTTKTKSKSAQYRKEKREQMNLKRLDAEDQREQERHILKVTEFVSVNELAIMMNVPVTEIISTCMGLGLFVSINQRLDAETMALLADEFGYKVEFVSAELQEAVKEEEDDEKDLVPRPPIVTVMGHVDHGKTKLLDYIRRTNVIAGEAGGITQHIGAYSVKLDDGRQITFLDTPGHEAFTAMRARGAQITDVAIIVVAADDGVMPQTVEAINHASAAGVPIVFAINKIDKPTANPDKIKEELAAMNYLVEDWGGKYQSQEISAKAGLHVEDLLDKVLLEAEMLDLKANPNKPAVGTILESSLDKGRGYVATVLVRAGTLKIGDMMLAGSCYGHIKAMYNERGNKITEVGPATPALVLGLNGAPQAGDKFNVMELEHEAKEIANKRAQLQREQGLRTQKHITLEEIGRRIAIGNFQELNIVVKGDVDGSVEALSDSLIKLSTPEIELNIIHKAVGQISESDVLLAAASNAVIVGFQVRPSIGARKLAEKEQIDIRLYSIIYTAIEEIKSAMEGMLSPEEKEEVTATLEVRETFKVGKVGTVAGCYVKEGKITRNTKIRVIRDGIVVYTGELDSLKRFKDDVKEVVGGFECGLNVHNFNDLKIGDVIEGYKIVEIKKTL